MSSLGMLGNYFLDIPSYISRNFGDNLYERSKPILGVGGGGGGRNISEYHLLKYLPSMQSTRNVFVKHYALNCMLVPINAKLKRGITLTKSDFVFSS